MALPVPVQTDLSKQVESLKGQRQGVHTLSAQGEHEPADQQLATARAEVGAVDAVGAEMGVVGAEVGAVGACALHGCVVPIVWMRLGGAGLLGLRSAGFADLHSVSAAPVGWVCACLFRWSLKSAEWCGWPWWSNPYVIMPYHNAKCFLHFTPLSPQNIGYLGWLLSIVAYCATVVS